MKIKKTKSKTTYIYTAQCYCNYCGMRMKDVKLETNYELEDEEPSVYSKKICKACRTGELE